MRPSLLLIAIALGCSNKTDKPAPAPPPASPARAERAPHDAAAAELAPATAGDPLLAQWMPTRLSADGKLAIGRTNFANQDQMLFRVVEVDTSRSVRDLALAVIPKLRRTELASGSPVTEPGLADEVKRAAELLRDFPRGSTTIAASPDGLHVAVAQGRHRVFSVRGDDVVVHELAEPKTSTSNPLFTPDGKHYLFGKATMSVARTLYVTTADGKQPPREIAGTTGTEENVIVTGRTARLMIRDDSSQVCAAKLTLAKPFVLERLGCIPAAGDCVPSPSGTWIACNHAGRVVTLDSNTRKQVLDVQVQGSAIAINDEGLVIVRSGKELGAIDSKGNARKLGEQHANVGLFAAFRSAHELVVHAMPSKLVVIDVRK